MMIIRTDEQLRKHITNALATCEGELKLYDRIKPQLKDAEEWFDKRVCPLSLIMALPDQQEATRGRAERVIALQAYMNAIPTLDLILTPNGFGIVSNQNVVPASKERVERLREAVISERDEAITDIISVLPYVQGWVDTQQAKYYGATLQPDMRVRELVETGLKDGVKAYGVIRERLMEVEAEIARVYIGEEQMREFRGEALKRAYLDHHREVIQRLKSIEIECLREGSKPNRRWLTTLVDYIKIQAEAFPTWHASEMKAQWTPPVFDNKKEDHAYWF